jgi:HK97 family phage prohead protease
VVIVTHTRTVPLLDIRVRSDGRTVDAYAAVFNVAAEITDQDGHYSEQNAPGAFSRSITEHAGQIFSVYNHARTLTGEPSDMWSVPLGKPVAIRADQRGLFTSTRFTADPAADRILEAIRNGALKGMSYTGVFVRSDPELNGGLYGPDASGQLPLVTRQEIRLIEYGPTPNPAFVTAEIVGVRSQQGA